MHGTATFTADPEPPPPGCDPDAIKLFVSNLPRTWEIEDIKPLMEVHGTVSPMFPRLALSFRLSWFHEKMDKGYGLWSS